MIHSVKNLIFRCLSVLKYYIILSVFLILVLIVTAPLGDMKILVLAAILMLISGLSAFIKRSEIFLSVLLLLVQHVFWVAVLYFLNGVMDGYMVGQVAAIISWTVPTIMSSTELFNPVLLSAPLCIAAFMCVKYFFKREFDFKFRIREFCALSAAVVLVFAVMLIPGHMTQYSGSIASAEAAVSRIEELLIAGDYGAVYDSISIKDCTKEEFTAKMKELEAEGLSVVGLSKPDLYYDDGSYWTKGTVDIEVKVGGRKVIKEAVFNFSEGHKDITEILYYMNREKPADLIGLLLNVKETN